ncbi:hypothetical protein ACHAQH_006523 [Verticillium albo-atrum]
MDPRAAVPPCEPPTPDVDVRRRFPLIGRRPSTPGAASSTPPATPKRASPAPPSQQSPAHTPTPPAGLAIRVLIKFGPPLLANYDTIYEACRDFVPSDNICQGLLRRLDHGCHDLITRRDSSALDPKSGRKPLRFEAHFTITRSGSHLTTVTYRSYQKLPLDRQAAVDVALATDRIIGTFLRRHDRGFTWQAPDRLSIDSRTVRPRTRHSSSLFPPATQDRLVVTKQEERFAPGYAVVLHFRSRCRSRQPATWDRRITIKSTQTTALTPRLIEGLTWKLSKCMHDALDARKRVFDDRQAVSDDLDEVEDSFEDEAVSIDFQLHNHNGANHSPLCRSVTSRFPLFQDSDAHDAREFAEQLNKSLCSLRDETDAALSSLDDLKIVVREITGRDQTIKNPFAVVLDSSICYASRTIEAALDRVQSGIAHVLYGKDVTLVMTATKRGHLVLEKTFVGRPASLSSLTSLHSLPEEPQTEQEVLLSSLKECIQRDVAMIILDTRSLSDMQARPQNLRLIERNAPVSARQAVDESVATPSPTQLTFASVVGPCGPSVAPSEPWVETNETRPETSVSTAPAALPHRPETPIKTIARYRDQAPETPSISRESSADISSPPADNEFVHSTPPSTPSLSDYAIETPRHSYPNTPPALQAFAGATEDVRVRHDSDASDEECEDSIADQDVQKEAEPAMGREPRRFGLLGRRLRPAAPVSEDVAKPIEVEKPAQSIEHVEIPKPADALEVLAPTVQEATSEATFEGWLGYSCEPIKEESVVDEQAITTSDEPAVGDVAPVELAALNDEIFAAKPAAVTPAGAPLEMEPIVAATVEVVPVEPNVANDIPSNHAYTVESTPDFEGWLGYSCEPLDEAESGSDVAFAKQVSPVASESVMATEDVKASEIPAEVLSAAVTRPVTAVTILENREPLEEAEKNGNVEAAETAEVVAVKEPLAALEDVEGAEPSEQEAIVQTAELTAAVESVEFSKAAVAAAPTEAEPITEAPILLKTLTLTTDYSEGFRPASDDFNDTPKTPTDVQSNEPAEPHTPAMTDDSGASDSFANQDHSPSPFPELERPNLTGSASSTSLTLWSHNRSPFLPDDFDFALKGIESPSKYSRPSFSRPQTSYGSGLSSIAPPLRRPQLQPHKRQFSTPTAGYLGLLHGHGSPLRMTSYVCSQLVDNTQDEGPAVRRRSLHRSPSSVLLGLGYEQTVEAQSRPGSAAGFRTRTDSMSSFGGRSRTGSILGGAGIWMK